MNNLSLIVFVAGVLPMLVLMSFTTARSAGSPFRPGTMKLKTLHLTPHSDGCPLDTLIHYPEQPGNYAPLFFLGGFYDFFGAKHYHSFLQGIAKHGYIVIGINLFDLYNGEEVDDRVFMPKIFEQMKWLEQHVTNRTKSRPDWSKLTLSCHSASCATILSIVREFPTFAAAAAFMDPVCLNSGGMEPERVPTKILAYTTSKSFEFPSCCVKGFSYKRVYGLMTSPKIRMAIRDFGHCGILDLNMWSGCNATGICHTGNKTRIPEYHIFSSGMVHAFMSWAVHGQSSMLPYLTDKSMIPLALDDLAFDLHPHSDALDHMAGDNIVHSDSKEQPFSIV